jgi:hypothetical protein
MAANDPTTSFIEAALWHGSLERAEAILAAHPEIVQSSISRRGCCNRMEDNAARISR